MGMKLKGLVLGKDTEGVDIGIDTVTQSEVDDPVFAPEQDSRFGNILGKNSKAASLAAGKQQRYDLFPGHAVNPSQLTY